MSSFHEISFLLLFRYVFYGLLKIGPKDSCFLEVKNRDSEYFKKNDIESLIGWRILFDFV